MIFRGRHSHRRVGPTEELVADSSPRVLAEGHDEPERLVDVTVGERGCVARACRRTKRRARRVRMRLVGSVEAGGGISARSRCTLCVRSVHGGQLRTLGQPFATELAQCLQQAVARVGSRRSATTIDLSTSATSRPDPSTLLMPCPAHTSSARSRSNDPANVDSRSKTRCSSSVSSSYDHCTRSWRFRCRGSVAVGTRRGRGSARESFRQLIRAHRPHARRPRARARAARRRGGCRSRRRPRPWSRRARSRVARRGRGRRRVARPRSHPAMRAARRGWPAPAAAAPTTRPRPESPAARGSLPVHARWGTNAG